MTLNAKVTTAKVTQPAAPEIGRPENSMYFLQIETDRGKLTINVGQKTHNKVTTLLPKREEGGKK